MTWLGSCGFEWLRIVWVWVCVGSCLMVWCLFNQACSYITHLFAFGSSSLSLGGIALLSLFPRKTWHCCWTARRRWPVHCLVATTQRSTPTASQCLVHVCSMRKFSRWGYWFLREKVYCCWLFGSDSECELFHEVTFFGNLTQGASSQVAN